MILKNNNLSPLPFYTKIEEQNHRRSYAYGNIFPLIGRNDRLLPFQILRSHTMRAVMSVQIYTEDGTLVGNFLGDMLNAGLSVVYDDNSDCDVIAYPALMPFPEELEPGRYYLRVYDGLNTWYSDIITLVNDLSGYLKLEWWDNENIYFDAGMVAYKGGQGFVQYVNELYLPTEVGKPEYIFEEEGESRDGYFFPEKQVSYKTYRFQFLAPEYLCDVLRLVRMSDHVRVTDPIGRKYDCDTFSIEPTWQEQGDLASVEAEFTTATVVKKTGVGYVLPEETKGDFNDDFNNDFDNE